MDEDACAARRQARGKLAFVFDGHALDRQIIPEPVLRMDVQRDLCTSLEKGPRQRARVHLAAADDVLQVDVVDVQGGRAGNQRALPGLGSSCISDRGYSLK